MADTSGTSMRYQVPELFVIVTRYVPPGKKIIRHVFGPYETRAKALTAAKVMKAGEDSVFLEVNVCKVIL